MSEMGLAPHLGNSAVQEVAAQLRALIAAGTLTPGERIKEALVAEEMGISRGPVREALRVLAGEGLVVLRQNRGAEVRRIAAIDVLEIYALREPLGAVAIRDAAETIGAGGDGADLISGRIDEVIGNELAQLADADGTSPASFVNADLSVQAAIVGLSRLPRTCRKFDELTMEIRGLIHHLAIEYRDVRGAVEKYSRILEDIRAGRSDQALERWRSHIAAASGEFLTLIPGADDARVARPGILPLTKNL